MPDIGETLREARMHAKIDVSEVEAATKIRAKYLRALENGEWDLLPGPTYVKSFLRTYAEFLGVDAKLLLDEFKLRHEPESDLDQLPIAPSLGAERRGPVPPRLPRWVLAVIAALALVAVLAYLGSRGKDNNAGHRAPTAAKRHHKAAKRHSRPAHTARRRAPSTPGQVRLALTPTSAVYVCLKNAQGKQLLNESLPSGAHRTFRSKRFRLTLGNNALKVKVNGRALSVPASPSAVNFEMTPSRTRTLPQGQGACP